MRTVSGTLTFITDLAVDGRVLKVCACGRKFYTKTERTICGSCVKRLREEKEKDELRPGTTARSNPGHAGT